MHPLEAIEPIKAWARKCCAGLAILDDTPRWNLLVAIIEGMAARVGQGGDPEALRADLHDVLYREIPLQLDGHPTVIQRMQENEEGLMEVVGLGKEEKQKHAVSKPEDLEK